MTLDIITLREQFPALRRKAIFLDNPGGPPDGLGQHRPHERLHDR